MDSACQQTGPRATNTSQCWQLIKLWETCVNKVSSALLLLLVLLLKSAVCKMGRTEECEPSRNSCTLFFLQSEGMLEAPCDRSERKWKPRIISSGGCPVTVWVRFHSTRGNTCVDELSLTRRASSFSPDRRWRQLLPCLACIGECLWIAPGSAVRCLPAYRFGRGATAEQRLLRSTLQGPIDPRPHTSGVAWRSLVSSRDLDAVWTPGLWPREHRFKGKLHAREALLWHTVSSLHEGDRNS